MFAAQAARRRKIGSVPFLMKILDIPQSVKKGLDLSMGGRYGQWLLVLLQGLDPRGNQGLARQGSQKRLLGAGAVASSD